MVGRFGGGITHMYDAWLGGGGHRAVKDFLCLDISCIDIKYKFLFHTAFLSLFSFPAHQLLSYNILCIFLNYCK